MLGKRRRERGAALIETAITLPILLLVSIGIFELGRAYQTWQVLTNGAREGARVAVIPSNTDQKVRDAVVDYLTVGGVPLTNFDPVAHITMNRGVPLGSGTGSQVNVNYPFNFMVLSGVMKLVNKNSTQDNAITMGAVAVMRNES